MEEIERSPSLNSEKEKPNEPLPQDEPVKHDKVKEDDIKEKEKEKTDMHLTVDNTPTSFKNPPAVSPAGERKQRPHPGPIIIPPSLNNKISHNVSFAGTSSKLVSPVKMPFHMAPVYTPPAMLSPRSIFFTGTSCGTPRSAQPLTPGRLLLSAGRRLSKLLCNCLLTENGYLQCLRYSKNPYIRTLNFKGQAAVGSYMMITDPNIRVLGS